MSYTIQHNKESFLLIMICLIIFSSLSFAIIKNHKPVLSFAEFFEEYRHQDKKSIVISNHKNLSIHMENHVEINETLIGGKLNYCFDQLLLHNRISLEQVEKIKNIVNNYYEIPNIANLNAEINVSNDANFNLIKEVRIQLDDFRYLSVVNNKINTIISSEPMISGQINFKKKDHNRSPEKLKSSRYTIVEKELRSNKDLRVNLINYGVSSRILNNLELVSSKDPLKFTALLETNVIDSKQTIDLLYFSVGTKKYKKKYYLHKKNNQKFYYDEKGVGNGSKSLFAEPIKGNYRISSNFGMRKHPILRYTRMHTGVDMAIAYGHPIKAAGDGIVSFAGVRGGYGKYIIINHAMGYKTAYGHLANFSSGLRPGKVVKQGDVIGNVGMTGITSGPHLHYELIKNNQFVHPLGSSPKLSEKLSYSELKDFKRNIIKIENELKRQAVSNVTLT